MSRWTDRVETMKTLKRCVRCGKQDAYTMNSHQLCYECTEKSRKYQRQRNKIKSEELNQKARNRYYELKKQGVCVVCGKKQAQSDKVMCESCIARNKRYYQKYVLERSNNDNKATCGAN